MKLRFHSQNNGKNGTTSLIICDMLMRDERPNSLRRNGYTTLKLITSNLLPSHPFHFTSWGWSLPYRNQFIDLQSKSVDWSLYNSDLLHESINPYTSTSAIRRYFDTVKSKNTIASRVRHCKFSSQFFNFRFSISQHSNQCLMFITGIRCALCYW